MLAEQIPSQRNGIVRREPAARSVTHETSPAVYVAKLKAQASLIRWELGRFAEPFTTQPQPPPNILRQLRPDPLMTSLQDAAEKADAQRFSEICASKDWKSRSSSEIMQAIHLALKAGALMTARQLATKGAASHSESIDLTNYAQLLAPPELLGADLPARPGVLENLAWLAHDAATYRRRWVALHNGKLVAEGSTLREVVAKVDRGKIKKGLLVTRVL